MAAGTESKIDTALFTATADSIGAVAKELTACFQDYGKVMQSMRGHWQGDTSDDIKNVADAVQKYAADLLRSLGGYRAALFELAGIYDKTEQRISEESKTLKFDNSLK